MKRIVLCFDGTWNHPDEKAASPEERVESNVVRFRNLVLETGEDGVSQQAWYNEGIGTSWLNTVAGGAFGSGLDLHIMDGYRHLAETYEDGDEVYVVGFSRGAYTARSLVGMIYNCGLVFPRFAAIETPIAYGVYRTRDDKPGSIVSEHFRKNLGRMIPIKFLGVWDTVGALGIPLNFASKLNMAFYAFHDTRLSPIVANAFHAVAIDEHRVDYNVTLWDPPSAPTQTLQQCWFAGAHADVGGGYPDRRLSNIALDWMRTKAATCGLGLAPMTLAADSYAGAVTDSYHAFLDGLYATQRKPFLRPMLRTKFGNECIDGSVERRRRDPALAYSPANEGLPPLVA